MGDAAPTAESMDDTHTLTPVEKTPFQSETVTSMVGNVNLNDALSTLHKLPSIPGLEIHTDKDKGLDYFFVDDLPMVPGVFLLFPSEMI